VLIAPNVFQESTQLQVKAKLRVIAFFAQPAAHALEGLIKPHAKQESTHHLVRPSARTVQLEPSRAWMVLVHVLHALMGRPPRVQDQQNVQQVALIKTAKRAWLPPLAQSARTVLIWLVRFALPNLQQQVIQNQRLQVKTLKALWD
jgi:hypothetical protein